MELSDFKDWARVVEWALPLYATASTNLPPELQQLIGQWQNAGTTDEERARLALEFVQDELRYTGLELGPDSYRPTPPFETFQKRFGDCKGKTLLLCTIFRAMNFEVWPALVNSYKREAITNRLPSPFAFNHVIVKLRLGGKTFWLDPTASHQGGALADRFRSRFGKALVIQAGVTALEDVPSLRAEQTRQHVLTTFRLRDYKSPALLAVQSTYRGYGADDLREKIARNDVKELEKNYLNFYARFYPNVASAQPLVITDDRKNNILTVTEQYRIPEIWKANASTKKREFSFYADSLLNVLTDPSTRLRKMPLRIPYPLRRDHDIAIHLPDKEWSIPNTEKAIEHDAFTFHYRRTHSEKLVQYHFDCETKVSELPAPKVATYLARLAEMETEVGEKLTRPDDNAKNIISRLNWLMVVVAAFGMLFTMALISWVWFVTRPASVASSAEIPPPILSEPRLRGLGGWLVLVGVGLSLGPPVRIARILWNWEGYFSIHVWQTLAMPQSEQFHPLFAPLLIFEMLGNLGLFGLNVLAVGFFFAKRKAFPRSYILLLWSTAFFLLVDQLVCRQIPFLANVGNHSNTTSMLAALRSVLVAIIWSAYMLKSQRVKATFVK